MEDFELEWAVYLTNLYILSPFNYKVAVIIAET